MLLNIIPPICISFYRLPFPFPLFMFSLFFLYCFGIYEATKRPKIVVNAIILNSYYLFFHMGFVIMWISKKYSEYLTDDLEIPFIADHQQIEQRLTILTPIVFPLIFKFRLPYKFSDHLSAQPQKFVTFINLFGKIIF